MTRSNTFNWGGAIVLSFVVFAGFIGTMVYRMISQRVDLVADNYYQQEEVYQKQIERIQHTSLLKQKSSMTYSIPDQIIRIALPTSVKKGEVTFFRPSDKNLDFSVPVLAQSNSLVTIPTTNLKKGLWKIQTTWTDGREEYYLEDEVVIK
ncbi:MULTISPECIES: FixH family protein [Bacteroidota]|uniref:FixH family protein n=1 Tax=Flectobacillus rivi TaxID=2984209 RepID=A0ABT6Z4W0_9BACT|nr:MULTISPECIES: FixH family protein [Bacteroidota]MDI9876156.1 FixH family protein [Flectobacillus rivi]NBB31215.1 nitrogen fixation protein FixH [Cellulophaga sp. BC115SP]